MIHNDTGVGYVLAFLPMQKILVGEVQIAFDWGGG